MNKDTAVKILASSAITAHIAGHAGNSLVYPVGKTNTLVSELEAELTEIKDKIENAITIAENFSCIDGAHHKNWVINEMVRYLMSPEELEKNGWNESEWLRNCIAP